MGLHNVTVAGATGLVGRKICQVLEERKFPVGEISFLASERSVGTKVSFGGKVHPVQVLTADAFRGAGIVFFAAGSSVTTEMVPHAVRAGGVVIDNSSAYRMKEDVPLVVPEVNRHMIFHHKGIIANPNCSTIQMVVPLKPLHDHYSISRIVVTTFQSVTGAGYAGMRQLEQESARENPAVAKFPHPIALNILPHVDLFADDGYTREEHKMVRETKKIMEDDSIRVQATCTRVPVLGGHSESVNIAFEKEFDLDDVRGILRDAPGVVVQDDPAASLYPMPLSAREKDAVFVGRIRRDETIANGLSLWIVSDNLRKGAATNAIQIAEELIKGR
ncbi:MAG: aspartate-semialdehyde dehydrogenase [Ignavibacteria bacterium]|nr:aspartate-semialdehyde dehydrogenase [Ignavibacteria bacterium]